MKKGIPRFWGLYSAYHNVWAKDTCGDPLYFPSPHIAQARLDEEPGVRSLEKDFYRVEEFGKQKPIDRAMLKLGYTTYTRQVKH